MFFKHATDYIYSEPVTHPGDENLYLPVELDTEFTNPSYDLTKPENESGKVITVQIRSTTKPEGVIYAHPDIAGIARHKVFKNPFPVVDYLVDNGYSTEIFRLDSWDFPTNYPYLQIDIYSFFAVAELLRVFDGQYREDVRSLVVNPPNQTGIEQGRRLRTFTYVGGQYQSWVQMPWVIAINKNLYRIRLAFFDTCAVQGNTNYATFCSNTNVTLKYKDVFTSDEKGRMEVMYINRPEDYDNYALGDLYNYDALIGNMDNFKRVYEALDLLDYFNPPRLTIGATVSRLIEAAIKKLFETDINDKTVISRYCKFGSADWLKGLKTTGCLNAKVDGGRCRNNRPTDTTAKGVICDIDISGCYGEGLRVQEYPLGIPIILDYPLNSEFNHYLTLREFLKKYGKELVPGLWQARVSLKPGSYLKYKQDFLPSWIPPRDISKMPTDSEFEGTDEPWDIDNVGEIKIFTNEVKNGLITHDFLQWLDNIASDRQRKELLDRLMVTTAMFYPASERVDSIGNLVRAHQKHKGKNTTDVKVKRSKSRKISIAEECHAWYGVNLGDLLVTRLLIERKKHAKKTPLNELFKLCINTIYGDMVSPFFTVGNVCVGNNITARARCLAWCMEKGLHGWQSITDGCAFDVNTVLYPREGRKVTGENGVGVYLQPKGWHLKVAPLTGEELSVTDNSERIELYLSDGEPRLKIPTEKGMIDLDTNESLNWVNIAAMRHLQRLFKGMDVLHQETTDVRGNKRLGQFEFEAKGFYDRASFHGSANYCLSLNGKHKFAMRSYSKKAHKRYELKEVLEITSTNYKPSEDFLTALFEPESIERSYPYTKFRILKCGDYKRNYQSTWKDTDVFPGCTVENPALLREFSLSQFTFQSNDQYKSWRREYERFIRTYGQSYEMFFLNDDATLNYQEMIEGVDEAIREGRKNWFDGLDKRAANVYRQYLKHIQTETLEIVSERLYRYLHGIDGQNALEAFQTDLDD